MQFWAAVPTEQTIYLISCVSKKRDVPSPARDLYESELFRRARAYVEASGRPWFILSAKHGLVDPDEVIAPYDETLNTMGVAERRAWAEKVQAQMDERLPAAERIVVFAGRRYREFLMAYFRRRAAKVEVPLEGLRIGEQLRWLGQTHPK
jgi:hypothetical protein